MPPSHLPTLPSWTCDDLPNLTVLDLCCGTGSIGLSIAKQYPFVKQIVGVDIVAAAVQDARLNARLNGFAIGVDGGEEPTSKQGIVSWRKFVSLVDVLCPPTFYLFNVSRKDEYVQVGMRVS